MDWITPAKPDYGQRLLPVTIDERATYEPEVAWCSLPYDDNDLSKGYEDITYAKFANAINQTAWLIHDKFGPSHQFDTIAYIGTPDIRYHMMEMAAVKTGYKVLFSSHMNSLTGHLSLFDKTNVKTLLSSQVKQFKTYPYDKTFTEAENDPFVILHTSGSTGAPKPIEYTLGSVSTLDHHRALPDVDPASKLPIRFFFTAPGRPTRMLIPFLHFHSISCTAAMVGAVFGNLIYVPGFRHRAAHTEDIFDILEYSGATTAFISPTMVEELARHPDSQWGTTETVKLIDLETEPEDFAYCAFETRHSGMDFVPVADYIYEMLVRRNADSFPDAGMFWRCPELDVFRPGDLWSPHPDPKKAKYVWKYRGCTDDLITGKDGVNFHPMAWEGRYSEHEAVRAAIVAGTGHCQPVLLLELHSPPTQDNAEEGRIVERIWTESITPINAAAPSNGKIASTHVIVVSPGKPFERSVKGTVAQKATIRDYEAEIERAYESHGDRGMA